jgi:hypothetical protein
MRCASSMAARFASSVINGVSALLAAPESQPIAGWYPETCNSDLVHCFGLFSALSHTWPLCPSWETPSRLPRGSIQHQLPIVP